MYYILCLESESEEFKKSLLPYFDSLETELLFLESEKHLDLPEASKIITYLSDSELKKLLPLAAKNKWELGILPHTDLKYINRGLGVSSDIEKVAASILDEEQNTELDLLTCNEAPVFQSLKIGNVFLIEEKNVQSNLFIQVFRIAKNIWKWSNLKHSAFTFSSGEEKIISTSALGVVVLAQSGTKALYERTNDLGSVNNGFLNLLIFSPQSILMVLYFLLKSIIPGFKLNIGETDFIGYIKTKTLLIKSDMDLEYSVDGEKFNAEEIQLTVLPKAIQLMQYSVFQDSKKCSGKNSFKLDGLPTDSTKEGLTKNRMSWLPRASVEEFRDLFITLRENAQITKTYLVLMALSTIMATFGLYGDSSPVIIGAMILAPLMSPIVSFSMAVVRYDVSILKDSLKTISIGTVLSLLFAAFVSIIIPLKIITSEMDLRLSPTLLDLGIAVVAGVAGAYAHAKESVAKSLAGVAIAVALVPPLAVAGIGIGWLDFDFFSGAFLLYLTNLSGMIMSAGLTFLILGFAPFSRAKRGLVYSLVILLVICIPLSFSFKKIMTEAEITKELEGKRIGNIVLKNVSVRPGTPIQVSLRIVSSKSLNDVEIQKIKIDIENRLDRKIKLEVVSAVVF